MGKQAANHDTTAFIRALRELAPAFDLVLDESLIHTLASHYSLLRKWNPKAQLTSVIDPVEAARFHYLESLFAAHYLATQISRLADIGSGAGFPGIPLALWRPDLDVVLIESQIRKSTFLQMISHQLGIKNLTVYHGRFQDYLERDFDVLMCRAIEQFGALLPDILAFGEDARQILLFLSRGLVDECLRLAEGVWRVEYFAVPLSRQRVVVSFSGKRST